LTTLAISVVVSARDAEATITPLLDGLHAQSDAPPFEVILVDNGSTDATADIAERHPLRPRVMRRLRGQGPGVARNEGSAAASGEVLAFTDADCAPTPRWLAEGYRAMARADIVQGAVRPMPGVRLGPFDRTLSVAREHGLYETANLFVARTWFERAGGFTDWVSWDGDGRAAPRVVPDRPFGEDAWLVWRARRLGATTAFSSEALVHHAVFPGDARTFMAEQVRLRYFPELVSRIPELRDVFAWRRYFLGARTAAFDAAAVSSVAALALTSPLPLIGVVPYLIRMRREIRPFGLRKTDALRFALALLARDAIGCAALVRGSLAARSPLF
jgi:glycosyltransferase involved in cell wall biosynthesis